MWQLERSTPAEGTLLFRMVTDGGKAIPYQSVVDLWADESMLGQQFRMFTCLTIASAPFDAVRFETPPVTEATREQPFEFVLLSCPGLARRESSTAFQSHFDAEQNAGRAVIAFPNLGRNATMIVPQPAPDPGVNHCHLMSFLRTADQDAAMMLWQVAGNELKQRINVRPVWLNTAGGGVAWLHLRLDDRPKYYRYQPFKQFQSKQD